MESSVCICEFGWLQFYLFILLITNVPINIIRQSAFTIFVKLIYALFQTIFFSNKLLTKPRDN